MACRPDRSIVITGGLGGFGLALAVWLVQRGARSLLLTSKRGLRTGAQARAIAEMRKHGVQVGWAELGRAPMHACTHSCLGLPGARSKQLHTSVSPLPQIIPGI